MKNKQTMFYQNFSTRFKKYSFNFEKSDAHLQSQSSTVNLNEFYYFNSNKLINIIDQ